MTFLPLVLAVTLIADPESAEKVVVAREIVEIEDQGGGERIPEAAREAEKLTVTSRRSDFDRLNGVVLFEGNARVDYSAGFTLCADRLFILLAGTNQFGRLVAEGNVSITNETRVGCCATAVFRRRKGEIEMFGDGKGSLARLAERGTDEIAGRRIKFWTDTEQVEIDGAEILVEKDPHAMKKVKKNL